MSTKNGLVCIAAMACALLGIAGGQTAFCQTRISETINNNVRQVVQGTAPKSLIANSTDAGRISGNQKLGRMLLLLAPSSKQDVSAAKTVAALHDPSSPPSTSGSLLRSLANDLEWTKRTLRKCSSGCKARD